MSIHTWVRQTLAQQLDAGQQAGFDEGLLLRAMLGVLVERCCQVRDCADLRQELLYLADNLDADRDYSFMRP